MFAGRGKTIPKSQQPDKTPFTIYHPNGAPDNWTQDYYQVVSIDPSMQNFGFRVERRYRSGRIVSLGFARITLGPPPIRRKKDPHTGKMVPIDPPPDPNTPVETYMKTTDFLDQYKSMYMDTHMIIMERQLPHNYKAVRISQHVISYFLAMLKNAPLRPVIIEVDSKLKSRQLGCPKGLNERQNKLWLIEKAMELCQLRQDMESYTAINTSKKKDDLADTICQIEAVFSYLGLPVTQEYKPIVLTILPPTAEPSVPTGNLKDFLSVPTVKPAPRLQIINN